MVDAAGAVVRLCGFHGRRASCSSCIRPFVRSGFDGPNPSFRQTCSIRHSTSNWRWRIFYRVCQYPARCVQRIKFSVPRQERSRLVVHRPMLAASRATHLPRSFVQHALNNVAVAEYCTKQSLHLHRSLFGSWFWSTVTWAFGAHSSRTFCHAALSQSHPSGL